MVDRLREFSTLIQVFFALPRCETIRDQTKDRKKLFRPILSAEISADTLSVLNLLSVCLQKEHLSAETPSFGMKYIFLQAKDIHWYPPNLFKMV